MNISQVLSNCRKVQDAAWYGGKTEMVFEDSSGEHQIALSGTTLETGWESYEPVARIYADGNGVYVPDDANVGSYHNTKIQTGACKSMEEATEYLQKNFENMDFHNVDSKPFFTREDYESAMADKHPRSRGTTMNKDDFQAIMDELPTNVFRGGKTDRSLVSADGHQIDFSGYPVESGYEYFEGGISVREDGHLLYRTDAQCVGPYDFKTFSEGKLKSEDEVTNYLSQKYAGQEFTDAKRAIQPVQEPVERRWDDQKYQRAHEREEKFFFYARFDPNDKARLVWRDEGKTQVNGASKHKVSFAYACDEMIPKKDDAVANPYLKSYKDRKTGEVDHSVLLTDDLYARLEGASKPAAGQWHGVTEALVDSRTLPNGQKVKFPDLSALAEEAGFLTKPDTEFNLQKHDSFVKQSMRELYKSKQVERVQSVENPSKSAPGKRRLPDLPSGVSVENEDVFTK